MNNRVKTFLFAIFAGIAIGVGGLLFLLAKTYIPGTWGSIVGSLLFPAGLITICYCKFNLYTGKIGIAPNPGVNTNGLNVIEWLAWILLGNIIGAFAFGLVVYPFTLLGGSFAETVHAVGIARETMNPGVMIGTSILCGILVYIAVYFFNKSNENFGKITGVLIPIAFFVLAGFQHCVANMFYMAASGSWTLESTQALVACILGNSVGGLLANMPIVYCNK